MNAVGALSTRSTVDARILASHAIQIILSIPHRSLTLGTAEAPSIIIKYSLISEVSLLSTYPFNLSAVLPTHSNISIGQIAHPAIIFQWPITFPTTLGTGQTLGPICIEIVPVQAVIALACLWSAISTVLGAGDALLVDQQTIPRTASAGDRIVARFTAFMAQLTFAVLVHVNTSHRPVNVYYGHTI